jgi:hypothetical protein
MYYKAQKKEIVHQVGETDYFCIRMHDQPNIKIKTRVFYLDLKGGRSHSHPDVESTYLSDMLVPRNATT